MDVINDGRPTANKDHNCDGYRQIDRTIGWGELVKCHNIIKPENSLHIKKGEKYINQRSVDGGSVYTWKSCFSCCKTIEEFDLLED